MFYSYNNIFHNTAIILHTIHPKSIARPYNSQTNIKNGTLSFRVNLNVNLHRNIKLLYNSQTNWDKYHGPLNSVQQAYDLAMKADPVSYAPTYPADLEYNWNHVRFGAYNQGDRICAITYPI